MIQNWFSKNLFFCPEKSPKSVLYSHFHRLNSSVYLHTIIFLVQRSKFLRVIDHDVFSQILMDCSLNCFIYNNLLCNIMMVDEFTFDKSQIIAFIHRFLNILKTLWSWKIRINDKLHDLAKDKNILCLCNSDFSLPFSFQRLLFTH